MIKIRPMVEEDIDAVRQVEVQGFGPWLKRYAEDPTQLPQRTRENIRSLMAKDPQGAFVAENENQVVGFIFSRTWGEVGWFGTFAVSPEHQGKGIGNMLISSSLDYLCLQPDRTIGLETMPDSPSNLGLYLKRGFLPVLPTFHLSKQLDGDTASDVTLPIWSSADKNTQQKWLSELKEATNQIYPHLDYSKEIATTANFNLGETLILPSDDKAVGFSTVRISSIREGLRMNSASIQVMAIHPAFTNEENLMLLINSTVHLAHTNNKQTLMLSVNACCSWALNQLLRVGFVVERIMIRMVLAGTDKEIPLTNGVNLSHWAG